MATRWGIVSVGKISNDFVSAMKVLPKNEHKVVAVAAQSKERAEEFANRHNIPFSYGSYEELVNNSDVEVIYIGVIHPQHFDVAMMCLNHGKHVLCEKPLCMNYKETETIIKLAKNKKLFLMEAVWSRCFPVYKHLRTLLENDTLGDIMHLNVNFGAEIIDVERLWKKELGGGTVLDIGVYCLQMALMVLGKPSAVKALGHLNSEGVDIATGCVLMYGSGATAMLSTSANVLLPNTATVVGTKGSVQVHAPFWAPSKFTLYDKSYKVIEEKEFPLPESNESFNFLNSIGLNYEAAEVRRCLKEGLLESACVSHDDSLQLAKLEDEIRKQCGVHYPQDEC